MTFLKKIYDASPLIVQNTMVNVSGAIKVNQRYGATYHQHREWLKQYDQWSTDRKLEHQSVTLSNFARFAINNSPFYKEFYAGNDVSNFKGISDLNTLPVLEKENLRREIDRVYTIPQRGSIGARTGGTTGLPLVVRYTKEDIMTRMAMLDHFKSRHGFENRAMKRASFGGQHIVPPSGQSSVFWRYNRPLRQMLYSTFYITEKHLPLYVDHLNRFKPQALDGYFTPLCDLASFIERHGIKLDFTPIAIFPTAETTTERGRELLERVFQAPVLDQYASSEGSPFVTECKGRNMHLELATGVIENIPNSSEVLVTSFHTHGTPLIRYHIGDSMDIEKSINACTCGLSTPLVKRIYGRSDDYLLTADGSKINSAHVASLLKYMPNSMLQAQIKQEKLGELTVFLVVDKDRYPLESDTFLKQKFLQAFGDSTRVEVQHVDEISREKSGKFRLIKNSIPNKPH